VPAKAAALIVISAAWGSWDGRGMGRGRCVALSRLALVWLAPVVAHAQTTAAPKAPSGYALSWVRAEGAEECPTARVVATEVERRLGRHVFDVSAERSFEIEVTRFGNTYRSDVYVRDVAGHAIGHRQLQSDEPGCGALLNATVLAVALVIDPEAGAREPVPAQSVATFEPAPPPTPPPPALAPPAPPPPAAPAPAEPAMMLPAPERSPVTVALRGQLSAGLAPKPSPGIELALGARPSRRWGFALTGSYTASQTVARGIGQLDVGVTRASALLTFEAGHSESVRLILGAGPSLGAFHVAVRRPAPVTDSGDFWFGAAELAADIQISVTKAIFVELGGSALFAPSRQQFLVRRQPDPVWRQSVFSGLGYLGVGAMFP
jgi:hypothetical protein